MAIVNDPKDPYAGTGVTANTGAEFTNTDGTKSILRPPRYGTTAAASTPKPSGIVNSQSPSVTPASPATPPEDPLAQFAPKAPAGESYEPITAEVQRNQTVQGQLGDILKTGNPLLEAAKARAAQAANARGLQNSSMAVQSGEEAMVNTALPIAQQDAAAYQKQALVNQDIANQFLSTKMGAKLDLEKAYEAFRQSNHMFDKDEKLKRYINDTGISSAEKITAMNNAAHLAAANISAGAQIASSNISASASRYSSDNSLRATQESIMSGEKQQMIGLNASANQEYSRGVSAIMMSDREPADKARAIDNYNAIATGNPFISQQLNSVVKSTFPPGANTPVVANPTVPVAGGEPTPPPSGFANDTGGG